ncbi:aminopeptidase [bacterium]|nr:aminopeptidase [bacterium]
MDKPAGMNQTALSAMTNVLDLAPSDRVLVVTDPVTRTCGEAFAAAAKARGCSVRTYLLPSEGRPLKAVPPDLLALLDEIDVVVNAIEGDPAEVPFRLEWIKAIEGAGRIRMGHSPGIDEEMMLHGPLAVDYDRMSRRAAALLDALEEARTLLITGPGGTDLVMDVAGRRFISDLKATVTEGANLPCGEIYCCPVETGTDGVLVVDGCFPGKGVVPAPVTIRIADGRAGDILCDDADTLAIVKALMDTDEGARTICELGIGVNSGARMTGNILEAEKTAGTAHIAFGSNEGMPGGRNVSSMHVDYLFTRPGITAVGPDGRQTVILEDGRPPA